MVPRWTALGLRTAEQKFRRIKGYRDLPVLVRELRRDAPSLDANAEAADHHVEPSLLAKFNKQRGNTPPGSCRSSA